jgi:hypothetical protein
MELYCAWCNPSDEGTDGICDNCMLTVFGIDPQSIHNEIAQEEQEGRHGNENQNAA